MKRFSFALSFASVLGIALFFSSCDTGGDYRKCEGAVWATTYHITYRSPRMLDDSIISVMQQVENSLSPFAGNSLVSRINMNQTDRTDSLFRRIFIAAGEVNRLSGGAFDPTVAPLVNLWGFGYRDSGLEPTQESIDSALSLTGIGRCRLDGDRIVKPSPMTEFDFSAITKGYGCDLIGDMLRRNGCEDFIVEIGGEVTVSGVNHHGEPWRIMIDAPVENDTAIVHKRMAVISVTDCGVATSGNYRNYRLTSQGKAWHTISTVTGRPAETGTLSATVIAPDAMMADALATSCMAMSTEAALEMIGGISGVEALLVTIGPEGYIMHRTAGFPSVDGQK